MTANESSAETCVRRGLLAALVAFCYGILCWRPEWMELFGIGHLGVWFLDIHAVLAASDAHALGLDPSGKNPLDLFHQPHVYSYWWFALHSLGMSRDDHVWLGALLGFVFLAVALVQVRVRSAREVVWSAAIIMAPPVILGFNRANADLLVFIILSAVVPCLLSTRQWARWIALGCILLATSLKFYPALAGVILLVPSRSRRETLNEIAVFAVLLVALAFDQAHDIRRYFSTPSLPQGLFTFGAGVSAQLLAAPVWVGRVIALVLGLGATVFWWRRAPGWIVPSEQRFYHLQFLLGAVLLVGCYLATINYAYRDVFAIWMAPFFWSAWSASNWPRWFQMIGRIGSVLLIVFLWLDGLVCLGINLSGQLTAEEVWVWTDRFLLAKQPLTATFMVILLGFIVPFLRDGLRALQAPGKNRPVSADPSA